VTYAKDIVDLETVKKKLLALATQVARRMRRKGLTGRTINLKVKYKDFVQITRSITLPEPTNDQGEIYQRVCALSQLVDPDEEQQLYLFEQGLNVNKEKELNKALDAIIEKFGQDAILPGTLLDE